MDQPTLRDRIATLHAELAAAHRADPAARRSLSDVLPHIQQVMDDPTATAADEPLTVKLERIAVQFEAEHPTVAASARRLVDLLGEVGI